MRHDQVLAGGAAPINGPDYERVRLEMEMWKTTIEVQEHFNQLGLQLRNFAITLLVATLGAAGLALNSNVHIKVFGAATPLAGWLVVAGLLGWLAFYVMDRWWYHRLLVGAVAHGEFVENRLSSEFPSIGLTHAISNASPFKVFGRHIHARHRLSLFYGLIGAALVLIALVLLKS